MKSLVTLMMFGLMLAACSREHQSTMTGAYGSAMLSGQVTMSGTSESSPAGVRVSVRGTGMATVLNASGEFAFVDVPENAELDFSRETDGVQASLRVDDPSSFLAVQLSPGTAVKNGSGRRRGVGRSVEPVFEIEGLIVSATAEQLVVLSQRSGEQTVKLTAETILRKGKTPVTPAELLPGVRVHVKAKKVEDAVTAMLVIVQNTNGDDSGDDDQPAVREYEGTVRSVSATQLVVFTSKKLEETFVLDAATMITKGNAPVAATDIQVGTRVHVKATTSTDGATKTALLVIVQNTNPQGEEVRITGSVASVGTDQLTVTTSAGVVTVKVNSSTRLRGDKNKTITLAEIQVGDDVEAEGTRVDATTILARSVKVED
ncbi:MAG TPA: DUF5666 domain-containing protein [Thermoanaerobaculia bacterium]|nr:DUF5666 domain-containing protein [Thermoanaerobaculia bacterium]